MNLPFSIYRFVSNQTNQTKKYVCFAYRLYELYHFQTSIAIGNVYCQKRIKRFSALSIPMQNSFFLPDMVLLQEFSNHSAAICIQPNAGDFSPSSAVEKFID